MLGFSLAELMIAITIGLIILVAVSAVFVSSKRTHSTQDRLARLQENARFAIHYLTRDLRMAGYTGCMSDGTNVNNTLNAGSFVYNPSAALEGLEAAAGNWYPSSATTLPTGIKSGTDALVVRRGDPSLSISISKSMPNESAELNVSSVTGLVDGDIIMVSDCASADVMQITSVQTASLKLQHNAGSTVTPGNSTQKLGKQYGTSAKVMKFTANLYYVKDKTDPNDATKTIPSLYMQQNGTESELVEGVEDLQITYGVDVSGATSDGIPDKYLKAGVAGLQTASEWARVKSIRIGLLVRTLNDKDQDKNIKAGSNYDVNGHTYTISSADKYQRRVFLTTVMLRNL